MTILDRPTYGNMQNPVVEERRRKQWEEFMQSEKKEIKLLGDKLEDFRDRQPPPVIQRYQEPPDDRFKAQAYSED